jgi:hypothetical protein
MNHFRGRLLDGGEVRLDPADVFIQVHGRQDGAVTRWNGYLRLKPDAGLEPGDAFTLRLEDGRAGELRIDHVDPDGPDRLRAVFDGVGPLR